jgi:hypothetical protein
MNGFSRTELLDLIWAKPTLAQIELTRNCNQRCVFCSKHCKSACQYVDLDVNSWFLIISKLKNLGVEVINKFVESLAEVATVESPVKLDGRTLYAVIAPKNNK